MTDRQALFAAVCAAPDADLPRLVMADHLDEHGEWERAAFIRGQVERHSFPVPADPLVLLDPADRDLFHLVTFRPAKFTRGFLDGVEFPDSGSDRSDPPIYPVDAVAGDWHLLCDLMARNPLVNRVRCPGWFYLICRRLGSGGCHIHRFLDYPRPCLTCGGEGVVFRNIQCRECGGLGHGEQSQTLFTPDRAALVGLFRREIARDLFGDDHPLFR